MSLSTRDLQLFDQRSVHFEGISQLGLLDHVSYKRGRTTHDKTRLGIGEASEVRRQPTILVVVVIHCSARTSILPFLVIMGDAIEIITMRRASVRRRARLDFEGVEP